MSGPARATIEHEIDDGESEPTLTFLVAPGEERPVLSVAATASLLAVLRHATISPEEETCA